MLSIIENMVPAWKIPYDRELCPAARIWHGTEIHCCEWRLDTGIYQAITLFSPKKPPVGPSAGRVAKGTGTFAACSVVRKSLCPFRSVATYPALTELTLMCVFCSSFAKKTVRALRVVLEALYARVG